MQGLRCEVDLHNKLRSERGCLSYGFIVGPLFFERSSDYTLTIDGGVVDSSEGIGSLQYAYG